jgi:hypothetical protein
MAKIDEIYNDTLTANAQNVSAFFSGADFIYLKSSDHGDWSISGDFTEVDFDLLVTLEPGIKRRVPLESFASTRELLRVPDEYSRSGLLMEVVIQASFSAQLSVFAVSAKTESDIDEIVEQVKIIKALVDIVMLFLGVPSLPALPGAPDLPALPAGNFFPAIEWDYIDLLPGGN